MPRVKRITNPTNLIDVESGPRPVLVFHRADARYGDTFYLAATLKIADDTPGTATPTTPDDYNRLPWGLEEWNALTLNGYGYTSVNRPVSQPAVNVRWSLEALTSNALVKLAKKVETFDLAFNKLVEQRGYPTTPGQHVAMIMESLGVEVALVESRDSVMDPDSESRYVHRNRRDVAMAIDGNVQVWQLAQVKRLTEEAAEKATRQAAVQVTTADTEPVVATAEVLVGD